MRSTSALLMAFIVGLSSNLLSAEEEAPPTRAAMSLFKGGVRKCLYHINFLVRQAHENDDSYAFVRTLGEPVDKAGYTLITVANIGDSAITRTFAVTPDESKGCSVSTTTVLLTEKSCAAVRDESLGKWKFLSEMGNAASYEREDERQSTIVLVPTPVNGCSVIKSKNDSFIGDEELKINEQKNGKKKV